MRPSSSKPDAVSNLSLSIGVFKVVPDTLSAVLMLLSVSAVSSSSIPKEEETSATT
jgi:hypothetical protein